MLLDLSWTKLQGDDLKQISEYLKETPQIRDLNLSNNTLNFDNTMKGTTYRNPFYKDSLAFMENIE